MLFNVTEDASLHGERYLFYEKVRQCKSLGEDVIKKDSLRRKPCRKCPYKLGFVETLTNPCPQCKQNDYSSYEWFLKMQYQEKEPEDKRKQGGV